MPYVARATAALLAALLAAGCAGPGPRTATPVGSAPAGAKAIAGVQDFRKQDPDGKSILSRDHVPGKVTYPMSPPVGGKHNPAWLNCEGTVYPEPVAGERAVHSLEHGAVWVAYRPGLPKAQVDALAKKVRGVGYTLMSPYPGLDAAVSLQAWGLQLKVTDAADPRIGAFIAAYRESVAPEPGATCAFDNSTMPAASPAPGTVSG